MTDTITAGAPAGDHPEEVRAVRIAARELLDAAPDDRPARAWTFLRIIGRDNSDGDRLMVDDCVDLAREILGVTGPDLSDGVSEADLEAFHARGVGGAIVAAVTRHLRSRGLEGEVMPHADIDGNLVGVEFPVWQRTAIEGLSARVGSVRVYTRDPEATAITLVRLDADGVEERRAMLDGFPAHRIAGLVRHGMLKPTP